MAENRFQPYANEINQRRRYKAWLNNGNAVPATTAARHRRQENLYQIQHHNNDLGPQDIAGLGQNVHNLEEMNVDVCGEDNEANIQQDVPIPEDSSDEGTVHGVDNSENSSNHDDELSNVGHGSDIDRDDENADDEDSNDDQDGNEDERWRPEYLPNLDEPFFPPLPCTKFECLLMILSFALRHGLTQVAMLDMCKLINNIFGGDYLPKSDYFFSKLFGKPDYQCHFYCSKCSAYVTQMRKDNPLVGSQECEVCRTNCTFSNMNDGNFFVTFPMRDQLRMLLENTENIMELLNYRWERSFIPGIIGDIYDGTVYSNLLKQGNFLSYFNNLSLTFNTDGASVFEGTHGSLWPIHYCVNEFPPSVRFDQVNTLLAGIWFGKRDPKMPLFLSTFVSELEVLYETGFYWQSPQGQRIKSKAILLNCVADSKARPKVQGVKCHNGYFGCGHCNHPGVMYCGSNQAKYPINDDLHMMRDFGFCYTVTGLDPTTKEPRVFAVEDRTNGTIRCDMEAAELIRTADGEGSVNGVKEKSILWSIPHFDLSFGFVIDHLHAVLLGVTRATAGFWFDEKSHGQPYTLRPRLTEIDARLLNIKPPVGAISRRPRSLEHRGEWHANEWRSWLLYYSIPCLKGFMLRRYLKHHCLLVTAIYQLLQCNIGPFDLKKATAYLGQYVADFKILYGGSVTYFNCHLLLHLGKCVKMWGPLFCFSAFSFESANGSLVKLVHGSRGVLSQIASKYTRAKLLPYVMRLYNVSETTQKYCSDLLYYRSSKTVHRYREITVLGNKVSRQLTDEERRLLDMSGHNVTADTYQRLIVDGAVVHATCYSRKGDKSETSVVRLKNFTVGSLQRIIDPENYRGDGPPKFLAVIRKINVNFLQPVVSHPSGAKASHLKACHPVLFGELFLVDLDQVMELVIMIDCIDHRYVSMFPNRFEKD